MTRLGARLAFFVAEAADEWRRSPGVNLLATATLAAILFVAALFLAVLGSVSAGLTEWKDTTSISVFLRDGASPEDEAALAAQLAALPGAGAIEPVDPDLALDRFRQWYGELGEVAGELDENPLPASIEVRPAPGADATALALRVLEIAKGSEIVEDMRYDREFLERLERALRVTGGVGALAGGAVLAAVAFVVGGVFRLAVLARKDEIEIMQLVGATPGLVRGPFLVAGALQGAFAGLAGCLTAEVARRFMLASADGGALLAFAIGTPLSLGGWALLAATGAVVGSVAAIVAVRRA